MEPPESVVFLVPGFPADHADTRCLPAVQNYIAAFAAAHPSLDTHVIAFQYPFVRTTYSWKGATVHALGGRNRRGVARLPTWARVVVRFRRLRRHVQVKALHSFWLTECAWVGALLARSHGVRHVASIGGQDARADNPYLRILPLAGMTLTAGSTFAAHTFERHSPRGVDHVIPLGLDTDHLRTIEPRAPRDIDILGVGSLIALKDYATFLDVVARLVPDRPGLRAVLIGDGPERESLARRIGTLGLSRHMEMTGALDRDSVFRHMLRSRVLLHPSRYEGQGYVFLEARFAGLSVVCRDVGDPGRGLGVFVRDTVDGMAAAVKDALASDPPPRASVVSALDTVRAFGPLYGLRPPGAGSQP